jgi:hypothetical protein
VKLSLKFEMGRVEVELADTPTARALIEALPFESKTHTWGIALPYGRTPTRPTSAPGSRAAATSSAPWWAIRGALPR